MIPVESTEILEFTPKSLINVPGAPIFRLRAPDERHIRRYNALVEDNNLEGFSAKAFNATKEEAIKKLWSEEDAQPLLDRFRTFLTMTEQNIDVPQAERDWMIALDEILFDNYVDDTGVKVLAQMRRKTNEYWQYTPRYCVGTIVCGWKSFDVPYRMEAGYMKIEDVRLIDKELMRIEEAALADKVEGVLGKGVAFIELWTACLGRTRLEQDEEKNLPAPSPDSSSQTASTTATNGASTEESGKDESTSSNSQPNPKKKADLEKTDLPSEAPENA